MASPFRGLHFSTVTVLVGTLQRRTLRTTQEIRRAVSDEAQGFGPALEFATRLGLVRRKAGALEVGREVPQAGEAEFRRFVVTSITRVRNRYRTEMYRFLRRFNLSDGNVVYESPVSRRSAEKPCRNFLMEMGLIVHHAPSGQYRLHREHLSLYALACGGASDMSPGGLRRAMASRDEIGRAAEEAVIRFERQRLGAGFAGQIEHVAAKNVAAGYDVKSVSVMKGSAPVPRYIEVKAVSAGSFRFFWSQNEVEVAKALREYYYLYLLPVGAGGTLDLPSMKMIPDPHSAVLADRTAWLCEANVVECRLAQSEKP